MRDVYRFGLHSIQVEEGLILLKYVGGATLEEFERQNEIFDGLGARMSQSYLLIDLSEAALSQPSSRKYAAERSRGQTPLAVICFGASLFVRAAALFVTGAARVLGRPTADLEFVPTEADARARVASLRAKS